MKLFRSTLWSVLALLLVAVSVAMRYPRSTLAAICRTYTHVAPAVLFFGVVAYKVIRTYRAGMSRPHRKPGQ